MAPKSGSHRYAAHTRYLPDNVYAYMTQELRWRHMSFPPECLVKKEYYSSWASPTYHARLYAVTTTNLAILHRQNDP